MKKKIIITFIIAIFFLMTGCNNQNKLESDIKESENKNETKNDIVQKKEDANTNDVDINDNNSDTEKSKENNTKNENSNQNIKDTTKTPPAISNNGQSKKENTTDTNTSEKNDNFTDTSKNQSENKENNSKADIIERIEATKEYYCTYGFELKGNKCEKKLSVEALQKYICKNGSLNGTKCKINSNIEVPINQYSASYEVCASRGLRGYQLFSCACNSIGGSTSGDSLNGYKCNKYTTVEINAELEYYCIAGTTLIGNKCEKIYSADALFDYSCPSNYTLIGTMCEKRK